ncbi:MAG: hypothetical protein L6R40_003745 [Gallowayella cf. fulva]|nr:MAG: hypothetical protein L6R40_003745 [Xanthomendoza cf. fulva]
MDEFAQTRTPDDLFDDDFTPITEPEADVEDFIHPPAPRSPRGRGDPSRGRGKPRPTQQQKHTPSNQTHTASAINPATTRNDTAATEPDPAPKAASAVRGDRSATGGNAKPKLTEEELSARLAAAKLNNAKREEAHRIAEADEASFQQREAQASQRRQEEGRARRLMDQEREKNRLRKLGAQGGREWDEGKEEQTVDPRRSGYRRGAHGGASGYQSFGDRGVDLQPSQDDFPSGRGFGPRGGRGRGDRGRGRGRGGRGRGGYDHAASGFEIVKPPAPNAETDFPALPSAAPPKSDRNSSNSQAKAEQQPTVEVPDFQAPAGGGQSWAEEVEGKGL